MEFLNKKVKASLTNAEVEMKVINIYSKAHVSTVLGFGSAFTESAAYTYSLMSEEDRRECLERYFGVTGIGYDFCRVHMGSCDFSIAQYSCSYKDDLSDFNIDQDKKYIIPMLKDALAVKSDIFLFASPWSPPAFMKDNKQLIGGGRLLKEYYPTYALYFAKFVNAYKAEGVNIQAVTVQNEAHAVQTWESCFYTAEEEADFAINYLRPALDANGLADVKILIWDHNRERVYDRALTTYNTPGADKAIWGMAYHWYSGDHFEALDLFRQEYPDKILVETEFCYGGTRRISEEKRAEGYALEYIDSLRNGSNGLCDWNIVLDEKTGGPYHDRTGGCRSLISLDTENNKLVISDGYRAVYTMVKNIRPGDEVVATTCYDRNIHTVAFKRTDGRIFLIALNTLEEDADVAVRLDGRVADVKLPAGSLSEIEIE